MRLTTAQALTTSPAVLTRRRVWSSPDLSSHSTLVLTDDRIYLVPAEGSRPALERLEALRGDQPLDELFGPRAVVIDLIAVSRLRLDLTTNALTVNYLGNGYATFTQKIVFASPETADDCFEKLWKRLGDGFRLSGYRRPGWAEARAPLGLLVGSLVVTALLVLLASVFTDLAVARELSRGQSRGLADLGSSTPIPMTVPELLLSWLDWRYLCAIGGVVAAVSQVWLYRRLTTPPSSLELIRN